MSNMLIKISLHSGLGGVHLGQKDVVVYCEPKNVPDNLDAIENWVNNKFEKNSSGENFVIYSKNGIEEICLDDEQIKLVKDEGHFFEKY